ncbi:hypothetical protein HY086_05650 [Candidatus Gottesmanbacteria bacterium]|nr:hypothetical protein [Candidatus Gottesmanbacteria bacterium]
MLKIPKQIYFDQETLNLYSAYAQSEKKPFAAVIREVLAQKAPMIKKKVAKTATKSVSFLDLYGSIKSPYKKHFSAVEERAAFEKSIVEHVTAKMRRINHG